MMKARKFFTVCMFLILLGILFAMNNQNTIATTSFTVSIRISAVKLTNDGDTDPIGGINKGDLYAKYNGIKENLEGVSDQEGTHSFSTSVSPFKTYEDIVPGSRIYIKIYDDDPWPNQDDLLWEGYVEIHETISGTLTVRENLWDWPSENAYTTYFGPSSANKLVKTNAAGSVGSYCPGGSCTIFYNVIEIQVSIIYYNPPGPWQ